MVDPNDVTKFDRTEIELQEFLLFCACVANKRAIVQAQKLEQFLKPAWYKNMTPFEYIEYLVEKDCLLAMVCEARLGQYQRLTELFKLCTKLDLETASTEELERIPGIGPKTSRMFVLHSRPNQRYAVLDTHILAWLREVTGDDTIPKSTPQSLSRYRTLERRFLVEADRLQVNPEDLDLDTWSERSRKAA